MLYVWNESEFEGAMIFLPREEAHRLGKFLVEKLELGGKRPDD